MPTTFSKQIISDMKKSILAVLASFLTIGSILAQIHQPVKWSFRAEKVSESEFDIVAAAKLDKGWYVYSMFIGDGGPIASSLTLKPTPQYQTVGKPTEISDHKKSGFDKVFEMNITKFSDEVRFVQRIKVTGATDVKGTVGWQTCDDEKCLPPDEQDFTLKVAPAAGSGSGGGASIQTPATTPQNAGQAPPQYANQNPTKNAPLVNQSPSKNTPSTAVKSGETNSQTTQNQPVAPIASGSTNGGLAPTIGNQAGVLKPVKWAFETKKISETEYDLVFMATIDKGWHIYSNVLKFPADALLTPVPTTFNFDKNPNVTLGKMTEASPKTVNKKEEVFDNLQVRYFEEAATFTQPVKDANQPITGNLEFQVCEEGRCLTPELVKFKFNVATGEAIAVTETGENATGTAQITEGGVKTPENYAFDQTNATQACGEIQSENEDDSLWWIFLLGFGGGLLAFLTPCVLPMVPLTVGFFVKSSGSRFKGIRNAFLYGLSIIFIYTVLGVAITSIFGADALNLLSTNAIFNIAMFVLLIVFAFSFFGYYEITLPSSWANKTEQLSDRGGILGIFFMAATLAIVSFSCTGLVAGSLLVQIAKGDGGLLFSFLPIKPLVGMFGFGLALALPFTLFALFPALLKSMPKSGGWMNNIKVTLGFLELALAFKFLSVADLTMGWKIVPYELMLGAWILCGVGLTLYFLNKLRFPYDVKLPKLSVSNWILAGLAALVTVYTAMGFQYNAVAETFKTPDFYSGVLPPAGHSYIYPKDCPLSLNCFHDFDEGVAEAKRTNKPILLDFTGYGCVNCRKMEDNVWGKPGVYELIRDKYVLISLYVDDRKALPQTYQFNGKERKTVGNKWSDFQIMHFNSNSQPLYVLLDPKDNKVLNKPVGFTPEVNSYRDFLQCGLEKYSSLGQKNEGQGLSQK
jgi:thiol:disulfide interchange protein